MVCARLARPTIGRDSAGRRAASDAERNADRGRDRGRGGDEHDVLAQPGGHLGAMRRDERQQLGHGQAGGRRFWPTAASATASAGHPQAALELADRSSRARSPACRTQSVRLRAAPQSGRPARTLRPCRASRGSPSGAGSVAARRNSACSSALVIGSSAPNGSSISSSGGSAASARARPARWRCPPDSSSGQRPRNTAGSRPTSASSLVDPRGHAAGRPAEQPRHGGDVAGHGHVWKQAGVLDDVAGASPQFNGIPGARAPPIDQDVASIGIEQPVHQPQQRRLARSAAARRARRSGRRPPRSTRDGARRGRRDSPTHPRTGRRRRPWRVRA